MNGKWIITSDQAAALIAELNIPYNAYSYDAATIYAELQPHQIYGFEMRQFLQKIAEAHEAEFSEEEFFEIKDEIGALLKQELTDYFLSRVFIDGQNGNGEYLQEDPPVSINVSGSYDQGEGTEYNEGAYDQNGGYGYGENGGDDGYGQNGGSNGYDENGGDDSYDENGGDDGYGENGGDNGYGENDGNNGYGENDSNNGYGENSGNGFYSSGYQEYQGGYEPYDESMGQDDGSYQTPVMNAASMMNAAPAMNTQSAAFVPYTGSLEDAQLYYGSIRNQIIWIRNGANDPEVIYFDTSSQNTVYDDTDITTNDNISLTLKLAEGELNTGFCLIIDDLGNVVVNGRLIPTEEADNYRLEALRRNISFDGIHNGSVHYSVIFKDAAGSRFFAGAIDLHSGKLKLSDKVLCVDFGTSNTTCGIYDDDGEIRIVRFEDVTSPEHKSSYLCPTLVYVSKIARKDPETDEALEVEYLFGYDAKQKLLENDYNPKGSIFFEIKRWITSPDQEEDITDGDTEAHIKRKEIISAYLHYIIKMAESDLKCRFYRMHFAAPVKLKSRFIQFLQDEVFVTPVCEKRYEIMSASDSIDEGVAIIYNQISEMISRSGNVGSDPAASGKIIIVDCGGGTTDLASCTYSYNKKSTGYDLNLETRFENGNSNFGGNNITYRIFQLLKIRLAARLNNDPEPYTVKSLIEMDDTDALNVVDCCIADATRLTIYDKIDRLSCETEQILPTDFNGSSVYAQKITTKMETKRNFYFLWQLAEKVKVALFTGNDVRCVVLNPVRGMEYPDSIVLSDPLSFFIRNPFEKLPPLKQCSVAAGDPLIITAQEVISLIQPDIYYLLAGMFDGENASLLNQCDYIKLAGQSCKIGLFRSLLKEFVPGRKLRSGETIEPIGDDSDKYKLDCVCGCIIYIRDKVFHFINSFNKQTNQNIIYDVELSRGGMERKVLFRGNAISSPEHAGDFAQFLHVEPYKPKPGNFSLRIYHNGGGRTLENEITIPIGCERYAANLICSVQSNRDDLKTMHAKLIGRCYPTLVRETGDDAITALISKLQSADLEDGESRVFVCAIPNSDGYSFTLYQILKCFDNGRIDYYFADTRSMNFENGVSFRSFFSGTNCEHDARLH